MYHFGRSVSDLARACRLMGEGAYDRLHAKNLIGGYNGARGIAQDVAKLSQLTFDEKYVAVLFVFYSRLVHPDLNKFYIKQTEGIRLQPADGVDFAPFAMALAGTVIRKVVREQGDVRVLKGDGGVWLGFWCHRVA